MKNAILIHGRPDKDEYYAPDVLSMSNLHWFPWLQKQLLLHEIPTQTPEMFRSFEPDYPAWSREFERYDITPETLLAGHSCGGGFLVRWLSEHSDVRVGNVVLVAPWIDPDRESTTDFFDFSIDPNLAARTRKLAIFHSGNDPYDSVKDSVRILRDTIKGASHREFQDHGHFTHGGMKTNHFPELLEVLVS